MVQTRENLINISQECGLSIACKINLTSVDFLDVRFDTKQETYTPYKKLLASFSIHFVEPLPLVLKEKDQHSFYALFLKNCYKRTTKV